MIMITYSEGKKNYNFAESNFVIKSWQIPQTVKNKTKTKTLVDPLVLLRMLSCLHFFLAAYQWLLHYIELHNNQSIKFTSVWEADFVTGTIDSSDHFVALVQFFLQFHIRLPDSIRTTCHSYTKKPSHVLERITSPMEMSIVLAVFPNSS